MAEEIQLTPEQEALYNQSTQPQPINPFRDFDANQLAELAVQDKENFDLVSEFQRNQDLWGDAATVQKTADALDIVKQRGFELSDLPGPATIGKTVLESAKGFGKQLWNYAGAAVGMAQGAITEPFSTELATGFAEGVSEKLAKNIAGTEEAMTGLAQIPEKVVSKAGRVLGGPRTPEQKVADLWKDVGRTEVQQQRLTGQGPFTQAVTGGVAGELPAEEVSTLAAGDPFSFATFSKGFQLGGKLIPGVVRAGAAKTGEALGTAAAVTGGRTIQAAGKLTEIGADAVKAVAPTTGGIAGAIKGGALGGPLGVIPGIGVGAAGGRVIARGAKQISTAGAKAAEVGKQVAGATPVTSALAQAGRDVLQSAPGAAGITGIGLVQDIGLAAVTSETPQETEGAIGIGTALGAAGAAGRIGRRLISGQLVAPREYGVNTVTPSSGNFPNLDTLHNQSIRNATPGEQTRLNAIRLFAKGSAPGTDIFFTKDKTALASALEVSGLPPEQARLFSEQEGFFATNIRDKSGTPRRVIVSTNVEAAPHEAFHAVQDVLGEAANREIDNVVREAYADQWEQFGQRYANRLVGDLAGRDWRETILDESGAGTADAVEKLSQSIGNEIRNQTNAEPAPGFVQDRVRAEWNRILTEARQRNPDATPGQIWRDILSPEESTQAADRYIARELAAENFDTVFKNLGAALDSKQPLTRRLARTAANLIATFGGEEPLVGRRSEIAQVEPRFAVIEAVTQAGRPSKPVTIEAKKKVPSGRTTIIPTTPGAQQDAAQQARTLSADAPETIQAGGTSSPRELLGQLAEAIAQRSGVKLNYLSAPGEPAAAITSNRAARRDIIEAFRTMPADARALWEKNFFPERVIQTKGGKYQVLGWSPEVFAANAHKLAGWLAEHPKVATPYAVDAATKSFTPDAWQQLYADTQQFVQNQQAGATGAGGELVVPSFVTERGFTPPAKTGGATAIAQTNADVINMLFGFKLPETPRIQRGKLPLAIAGEEISAATLPGRVEAPVRPRGEFTGIEAAVQDIAGRSIQEVNPFRNEVEAAGNPPSMIEAIQRLNLENIREVAAAPEIPEFRGNTLTLTAGFQPVAETAGRLVAMTPEEWKSTITGYTGKLGGGLTGWAFDLGASAKNVADVTALREAVTQLNEAARSISIADEGGFDRKMDLVGRGQAAREAFEAATGSNLEGTNEGSALPFIRKHIDANYKPPVPGEVKPVLKMAAQPRKLSNSARDEDFKVVHYSSNEGLKQTNPKFFGKGKATPTDLRGAPKTYFFVEGSDLGQDSALFENAGLSAYETTIPGSRLYDIREGRPDDLNWRSTINREEADDNIRAAGYDGIVLDTEDGRQVVAMFKPVKVTPKTQFQPARENETSTLFDLPEPKSFPEAVKPKRGQTDIPSDIVGSPLAKQAETREAAISLFADKLKQEAERQSGNPAYNIGKRWYSEFTPELKREFGDDAPLMAELLAATSPQTNVETNFGYAIDVLNNWKAGKFDKLVAKLNEGYRRLEDGSLEKIYRRDVREGKVENPPENPTDATYMAHWILKHDLLPRGTSGQQVGLHSKNVAKVLTRRWLGETRGPKTKNFVQNLLGTGDEATIDIWADRLLRRVGYEGLVERWRILPENVRGVSDDDFEFGQAAFREAAKQLKMKPSDLQAALWFTEKQRWADNGWSDKLDLGDFRTEIKRTAEYRKGFAEGRGPAEVRQESKQPVPEYEQIGLEITPRRRRVE